MRVKINLFLIFALLGLVVKTKGQSSATCDAESSSGIRYKDVLLTNVLSVTTQHFSETSVGSDGFSRIDADQRYNLPDLFELRYGSEASTAGFLVGFLDILNSRPPLPVTDSTDYLSKVIGLVLLGEFDAARAETSFLIFSSLPESFFPVDLNEITPVQETTLGGAIRSSLNSIRQALGNSNFEIYLNLKVGSTLSFAIDTTGSMAGEIEAARERIKSIITSTAGTLQQPLLYVLSPFNDPTYGPVTRTNDPDEVIGALELLVANGGGDGPELALKGIELAILGSTRRSVVFMITDAQAKDVDLTSRVIALAIIRKVRVISLLTNNIGGEAGFTLYDKISSASGGLVTVTDKSSIGSITELFTTLTAQGQVKLQVFPASTLESVRFTIDSTTTEVSIILSGSVTFNEILNEVGDYVPVEVVVSTTGLILLRIPLLSPGEYEIYLSDILLQYSMEIAGQSTFGAIPTILQNVSGNFLKRPQLRAGESAHVVVTLFGNAPSTSDQISGNTGDDATLEKLQLVAENGTVLLQQELSVCGDAEEYRTTDEIIIPSVRFFVKLIGYDRNGFTFVRVDPCAMTPLVANIELSPIDDITIDVGESVTVTTTLSYNEEASATFDFDVSDPLSYVTGASPSTALITSGSTQSLAITIRIPTSAEDGSLSIVTVTASPAFGDEFVFLTFTVTVRDNSTVKCPALRSQAGSIITCSDFNNVGSVCQVSCEAGYALFMTSNSTCQRDQTWTDPDLSCAFVGSRRCSVSGDPHYLTFDGQLYDFQGTCIYTIVQTTFDETTNGLEPFSIEVENEHLGGGTTVSWFKRAYIEVYNTSIVLSKGKFVTINGVTTVLPFSLASEGLRLSLSGLNVVLTTRFGLTVTYNGQFNFVVRLSASYTGLVKGLCGNLNGDPDDDLTFATNATASLTPNEFGNSFKVGGEALICQDGSDRDGAGECLDEDEYESLCDIVEEGCFEECAKNISNSNVLKNCVFDLCVTQGEVQVLEQALSEYADSCQESGISICDWREDTGTPIACPSNSHYEHEGTSCPNTCQSPTRANRCTLPKVSGCICNDGFVLSGVDCVPISECGCTADGIYYKANDQFYSNDCTSNCICKNGFLNCTESTCGVGEICKISSQLGRYNCEPESTGHCVALGDPHYTSFDGQWFDFQGTCTYLLARVRGITISAENENRNGNTLVSYVKNAQIHFEYAQRANVSITLGMLLNGQPAAKIEGLFTNGDSITDLYRTDGLQVYRSGVNIIVDIGKIKILYQAQKVRIELPGYLSGQTFGLCGNFNGDPSDDPTMMNGTLTSDMNAFADSYRIGDCANTDIPEQFECTAEGLARYGSEEFCGKITSPAGLFVNNSAELDLEPYFNNCVYDMCATGGSLDVLERTLESIVEELRGVLDLRFDICRWREITGTALLECPENSHYAGCTSACPNTCLDPFAKDRCGVPDVDGCECNFGYVWNQGKCVRLDSCGCYHPTLGYLERGYGSTDSNCTTRCGCNGPNKFDCEDASCSESETCTAVGDDYECISKQKTCILSGNSYVSTFDEAQFNFNGECSYVLTGSDGDDYLPKFSVIARRYLSEDDCTKEMKYKLIVNVGEDLKLVVSEEKNGLYVNDRFVKPGTTTTNYKILTQSNYTVVKFPFGLVIRISREKGFRLMLTISEALRGSLTGLCGDADGSPDNDFDIPNDGEESVDPVEFGNFWRFREMGEDDDEDKCVDGTLHSEEELRESCANGGFFSTISTHCGLIAQKSSVYETCQATVDPHALVQSCITSICKGRDFLGTLENTIVAYHLICKIRNQPFEFDSDLLPVYDCPPNSAYNANVPPCVKTCADPEAERCSDDDFLASLSRVEGCVCNEGFFWMDGRCVERDECGCQDPETGYFVDSGECNWDRNCSRKCECRNGEWMCQFDSCDDNEVCGMRDGIYGCHFEDECRYDNGGCSHICTSSNASVVCSCPNGMFLKDEKNCQAIPTEACLTEKTIYTAALKDWRSTYQEWRYHYKYEYLKVFNSQTQNDCTASVQATSPSQYCNFYWSRWYNTDSPVNNCGDDETLSRIQQIFPDEVCESPLAVDVRMAGQEGDAREASAAIMKLKSGKAGLLCRNSDQEAGRKCPDFEVRFLCEN